MDDVFGTYSSLEGQGIYRKLSEAWEVASIDREISFREKILVPVEGQQAQLGAALYLAVMAYPEDESKQDALVEAFAASLLKQSTRPGTRARRELRQDPDSCHLLGIPNKRIDQGINAGKRRISKRVRAAWVVWKKVVSNPDPAKQTPLADIIAVAARQNTRTYPAYSSTQADPEDAEEAAMDSFRRQVLKESKPVIHLSMAFYLRFETGESSDLNLYRSVLSGPQWLKEVVIFAEILRVSLGDLLPRRDSQYASKRIQNFSVPLENTVAVLPFIDPLEDDLGFYEIVRRLRHLSATL